MSEQFDPRRVIVAVPTRGEIQWATVDRLQAVRDSHPGLPPIWYSPCHLGVTENQNLIVERFLSGPMDVLVLIEEDVVPSIDVLDRLVPRLLSDRAAGVTFQPYLMALRPFWANRRAAIPDADRDRSSYGLAYCVFEEDPDGDPVIGGVGLRLGERMGGGWRSVYAVGTGCTAISRRALERMGDEPFTFSRHYGEYVGNDVAFCHEVKTLGLDVLVSWDAVADHVPRTSLESVYRSR